MINWFKVLQRYFFLINNRVRNAIVKMNTFGVPVEPEVYITIAVSSGVG